MNIFSLNPWRVKLFTKQACRENVVVSFVPLKIFLPLCFNVLSTVPRENLFADSLYIYIYIYIYITNCIYIFIYIYIYMYVCIYSRWGVYVPYFDGDKTMLGGLCFFNYFVTPFSTSKFWMKTSKHWAINSSFHTISCVLAKPKLVRAIYNLVYTSPWDMNGLGKTKTKWRGRERIGAFFFFSSLLFVVDML